MKIKIIEVIATEDIEAGESVCFTAEGLKACKEHKRVLDVYSGVVTALKALFFTTQTRPATPDDVEVMRELINLIHDLEENGYAEPE